MPNELSQIKTNLGKLRKLAASMKDKPDDTPLSFEFILLAFFPTVWSNIQSAFQNYYTQGYIAGLKENEDKISE